MIDPSSEPDFGSTVPPRAVSVLPADNAADEFPVLKAFQQYIDAEQEKARKRLLMICSAFAIFMLIVVSVFVILLINVTQRNQALNDRLVDFAMKERDRPSGSAVVVQPAPDNSALMALTSKLEEMRKNFEAEKKARESMDQEQSAAQAAQTAAQDQEIQRLKKQLQQERDTVASERAKLAKEKEKVAAEKARQKEIELEAYRRKHYPELYQTEDASPAQPSVPARRTRKQRLTNQEIDEMLEELDLDSDEPIKYFSEDDEYDEVSTKPVKKSKPYKIPVETLKPQPESRWRIPN